MAANISVEEIIEMVTTDSLGDEDENEELIEDSDNFEDVMSQKLDELGNMLQKYKTILIKRPLKNSRFDMA